MKSFKTIFPSICDTIASPTRANKRGGGNLTSSHHFFNIFALTFSLLLCTQGVWGDTVLEPGTNVLTDATKNASGDNVLILKTGTYTELSSFNTGRTLTIKAADGAKPIVVLNAYMGVKFDCDIQGIEFQYPTTNSVIRLYDGSNLSFTSCYFLYTDLNLSTADPIRAYFGTGCQAVVNINDCIFEGHRRAIYLDGKPFKELNITNTTFMYNRYRTIVTGSTNANINIDNCTFCNRVNNDYDIDADGATGTIAVTNTVITKDSKIRGNNKMSYSYCVCDNTAFSNPSSPSGVTNADPKLTYDATTHTITVADDSPILTAGADGTPIGDPRWLPSGPTPYSGNIYPIGENFTWAWTIGGMPQMTNDGEGHYTWSGWMNGSSSDGFKFLCQKTNETWYPAFMPKTANQSVEIGTAYDIQYVESTTDNKFKLANSGYYTISLDLSDKDKGKMTVTDYTPEMRMLYLNPGGSSLWDQGGAKFSVYSWKDNDYSKTGDAFLTTTGCSNGQYVAQVPMEHTKVIFIRNTDTAKKPGFDEKWNQTANLDIPTNGNNMYTITGWGSGDNPPSEGSWGINPVSQYTVTLDKTEGTIVSTPDGWTKGENLTKMVDCGSNVILPALSCMSRTGYNVVDNWFDGSGNPYAVGSVVEVTSNQTFYTHWTAKQVNVTFNANTGKIEGQDTKVLVYTYDGPALTLPTPQKTGYNFMGWFTSSTGGTQINNVGGSNKPLEDVEYFAQWTPKTTVITLNANTDNHGKTASSVTATYGQSLPSFTACTTDETGYSLTGYWTGAVGGTMVIDASGTLVADLSGYTDADGKWAREGDALTLYAQYTIHTCDEYWLFTGETRDNTHFGGKTEGYTGSLGKGVVYPDGKSFQYGMYIAGATTLQSQSAYWQSYKPTNEQVNITVYAYTSAAQDVAIFIGNSTADAVEVKRENVAANTATIVKYSTSNFEIGKTIYVQWMNGWAVFGNIYVEDCVPAPTDPWAVYGNFDGSYKAYLIENGTRTINSLAKETEYEFKITKNNDATIWYTDQNSGTMTENSYGPWDFSKENGANTKILTAAAGDYTFTVNTEGNFPVVSVAYPTSYTVSFEANGGTGTMDSVKHFAPNDSYTIPDCGFTYANMHFTGWKDQNNNDLAVGAQVTITSHLTLTAQWEKAVVSVSITAPDNINEIEVGQTLQLTAHITPADATYGTEITWTSSNTTFLTVDENGLVTAHAQGVGHYITATSSNGKTATYSITVTSGSCENVWQVHMWNESASTNTSHCMHQVGTTTEWRTDPVVLPSASDAEKLKVLYNNAEADKSKEWQTNWVPFVGHQYEEGDKAMQFYPMENSIGYFRIFTNYTDPNYFLAFQPTYRVTMGAAGQDWVAYNFAQVNDSHEYETELVQVPSDYKTFNYYVGTLHSDGNTTIFVSKDNNNKSQTQSLSGINGLKDQERAGQYGKYYIYDNSKDQNWYCQFKLYWTYELRDDDENVIYVAPGCEANVGSTTTLYNENLPTKTGYQQIGWSRTKGGSKVYDLGASYTYNKPVDVFYPVWQANTYTLTLAVGEHGSAVGSATVTYDATALTAFTAVTPAAGYNVTGYYSDETKVLDADGTFASDNVDGFITNGQWTKAENCTLTAHYSISTTTITIDPNGGTVGSTSVTATYGQSLPNFDPCQAPQTKILVGYTVGGNLIINRDGTLVPNTDYADANGKWKFTGSALTVLASYRDAEEICKTFCTGGDISASGTYHYNDFTIETNITSFNGNRGTLESGKYIIITNPNGFSPTTCAIWANAYGNKYAFKYTYSPNIDGSESFSGTTTLDQVDAYLAYYVTLPAGTKYIKFERVSSNIAVQNVCIAETGYVTTITIGANDVRELPNQVDNLVIYEGGQVTNESLTINKSLSYKRTIPGTDIWATISLPFDAYRILVYDQDDNEDYPINPAYGEKGEGEIAGYFFMKELTQSTEEDFQNSWTHIKTKYPQANTPYIVSFPQVFDNGYFAKNTQITYEWRTTNSVPPITINRIEIPSGPYYSKEDGREFILCANPNLMGVWLGEGTTAYLLTEDGTCFDRVDEPVIPPFSAYVIATQEFIAKCPRIMLVGGGSNPTDFVPIYSSPDMQVENRKVLIQGQIYIYRAGKVFDLTGNVIY